MRLSGSRYHLATLCGYPFRPDVIVAEGETSAAAALGSEAHRYVEARFNGEEIGPLFLQPKAIRIGEQVWSWVELQGRPTHCEIKVVYDAQADTARRVDEQAHPGARNYGPTSPTEIPVTLDLAWDGEEPTIYDVKTGKRDHAHREQLVIQALAFTRLFGRKSARVGFVYGRLTKCEPDALETLDAAALDAASWEVAATLRGLPFATTAKGQHCFFCPVSKARACPAYEPPTEEERNGVNA